MADYYLSWKYGFGTPGGLSGKTGYLLSGLGFSSITN